MFHIFRIYVLELTCFISYTYGIYETHIIYRLERITSLRFKETIKAKIDQHKGSDSHDELLLMFLNYFDMTGGNPRENTAHSIEETRKLANRVIKSIKGKENTTDDKLREILNTVKSEGSLRSTQTSQQPTDESPTREELQRYVDINKGHAAELESACAGKIIPKSWGSEFNQMLVWISEVDAFALVGMNNTFDTNAFGLKPLAPNFEIIQRDLKGHVNRTGTIMSWNPASGVLGSI